MDALLTRMNVALEAGAWAEVVALAPSLYEQAQEAGYEEHRRHEPQERGHSVDAVQEGKIELRGEGKVRPGVDLRVVAMSEGMSDQTALMKTSNLTPSLRVSHCVPEEPGKKVKSITTNIEHLKCTNLSLGLLALFRREELLLSCACWTFELQT